MAKKTYVIHLEMNGGKPEDDLMVKEGKAAKFPFFGYNGKYAFAGLYEDPELTVFFDESTPITEDKILYAAWGFNVAITSCERTDDGIVMKFGGSAGGHVRISQGTKTTGDDEETDNVYWSFISGREVTVSAVPKPAYKFVGWVKKVDGDFVDDILSTETDYTFILNDTANLGALFEKNN